MNNIRKNSKYYNNTITSNNKNKNKNSTNHSNNIKNSNGDIN